MRNKKVVWDWARAAGLFALAALAAGTVNAHDVYQEFRPYLAVKADVVNLGNRGVVLLDRHGEVFFTFAQARRIEYVPLTAIPASLQQAVIAVEDHRFYRHPGFSLPGMARAMWWDIQMRTFFYGGSTITQQLVKNALLSHEKSLSRKWREIILAVAVERHFSKEEILEMYLNTAYFGQGMVGVENAAQHYFGKPASELTPEESYFLVALLPSPSTLLHNEERLMNRQRLVVGRLHTLGFVSDSERDGYQPMQAAQDGETEVASATGVHFALMVKDELVARYGQDGLVRSGLTVKTTLDLGRQREAERLVREEVARLQNSGVHNGAAVVLDPARGDVLALVGSRDWHDERWGKLNIATTPRQTGSAFKPIVYAAAFEQRAVTPATVLQDKPTTFGKDYRPVNYDGRWRGPVSVRRALANSLNVPAVEVMSQVGVRAVVEQAQAMGISSLPAPEHSNLALALGAGEVSLLELTNAYGVLANEGQYVPARLILGMEDKLGKPIDVPVAPPKAVLSRGAAFLTTSILSDERTRREVFGQALSFPRPAAVKTGTTQKYRDAWTVGFTPSVVTGVWVGNNDNASMNKVAGSLGAAPIWKNLMTLFTQDTAQETFTPPPEVLAQRTCGATEYFLAGTEAPRRCYLRSSPSPSPPPAGGPAPEQKDRPKPEKQKPRFIEEEYEEDEYEDSEEIALIE